MKIENTRHRERPWRIHELCRDFTLLDVTSIPIEAEPARGEAFSDFVRVFVDNGVATDSAVANGLFALRLSLGKWLHLDSPPKPLSIPGCAETSVVDRLSADDRARNHEIALGRLPIAVVPVYLFEEEALLEISNRTIHALLHLGWVDAGGGAKKSVELAVYIKSRGPMSDAYMTLIKPFRHTLVYPPWISRLCRIWKARRSERHR